jgi:acylphosphatase
MIRLTARISGRVEMMAGYKAKVAALAGDFGLSGFIRNLPDGWIEVVAEGEKAELERFASALGMDLPPIRKEDVETTYSDATGEYAGFCGLLDLDEVCERLDEGVEVLKEILVAFREGFRDLGDRMDAALKKQNSKWGSDVREDRDRPRGTQSRHD